MGLLWQITIEHRTVRIAMNRMCDITKFYNIKLNEKFKIRSLKSGIIFDADYWMDETGL